MKAKIDLKSALYGVAVGVLVMLAVGATTSTPPGKYQITGTGSYVVMVDTTTGRAWVANFASNIRPTDGDFFQPKADR